MSLFALHKEITLPTSDRDVVPYRPLLSMTRTELAPAALISAKALVLSGYTECMWLTPRSTKSFPLASTSRPLFT